MRAQQLVAYQFPPTNLVRADGVQAPFPRAIDDGLPVVLAFISTSCTSNCLSETLAGFQRQLGPDRDRVHMVSISTDPEEDTPARLLEYAARFGAGPEWEFYTGTLASSVAVQKAFQAWSGDKTHQRPLIFLRAAPGRSWLRLEGQVTASELMLEYRRLVRPQ